MRKMSHFCPQVCDSNDSDQDMVGRLLGKCENMRMQTNEDALYYLACIKYVASIESYSQWLVDNEPYHKWVTHDSTT